MTGSTAAASVAVLHYAEGPELADSVEKL